ncbi:MAG: dipeptidase [Candidatus Dojkabacteria bacterium]
MTQTYKTLLKKFISYKSISTDYSYKGEMMATAEFLKQNFEENGLSVKIVEGYGNPIVIAKYNVSDSAQTCLIYGHYDVQPADKAEGWDSDPFEVFESDERLFARGIVDNKGQVLIHIATVFDLIKEGNLKYNIIFFIEGDEETGSPLMSKFVDDYKNDLACDFFMISDGEILGDTPIIEAGFRGGANTTLTLRTANTDVHSGIYGGGVPSASHEAAKFITTLFGENQKVLIDGFYNGVDEISQNIRENNESIHFSKQELESFTGIKDVIVEEGYDFYTATSLRPTIQVTGLQSGYVGEGYRNGIPSKAVIKINFRLVKSQNPHEVLELYRKHIEKHLPRYVSWELEISDPYEGIKLPLDNEYIIDAKAKLTEAFGKEPKIKFSGGGLPIVTLLVEQLGVQNAVLVPLGNEDCNMHGINENYNKDILEKGLNFSKKFLGS